MIQTEMMSKQEKNETLHQLKTVKDFFLFLRKCKKYKFIMHHLRLLP